LCSGGVDKNRTSDINRAEFGDDGAIPIEPEAFDKILWYWVSAKVLVTLRGPQIRAV
jgi:hypothetical protein